MKIGDISLNLPEEPDISTVNPITVNIISLCFKNHEWGFTLLETDDQKHLVTQYRLGIRQLIALELIALPLILIENIAIN